MLKPELTVNYRLNKSISNKVSIVNAHKHLQLKFKKT